MTYFQQLIQDQFREISALPGYKMYSQLRRQVCNQVADQVWNQVCDQLWVRALNQLWNQVDRQPQKEIQ
jgi:hypothetical protein